MQLNNAKYFHVVMSMYNLLKFIENSKITGNNNAAGTRNLCI